MNELGGSDLEERTRQASPKQLVEQSLWTDLETAIGLRKYRYYRPDILGESTVSARGVTRVVTPEEDENSNDERDTDPLNLGVVVYNR
ncbi:MULTISPECIES: hypothetical protein [Natrialbaceae]|uniref:hypothetical protein n=1 Tax=Natrialbaceae TaxID=1644061 RepID=UPI00207C6357|nr:hypothetical protein [Natronococcus sp. CG52]